MRDVYVLSEISKLPGSRESRIFRGHISELDAIRGLGIGLVLINHFWPEKSAFVFQLGQLGWIAMDAFFVLSGFLITGILLDSQARPDYFSNYYIRRALRIFPLYYLTLLLGIVMLKLEAGGSAYRSFVQNWGSPGWFFVYLGNIKESIVGQTPPNVYFSVLWSLQIEEQFYLLFPFLIRYMRRDHLVRLLWCLVFLSPVCRLLFYLWVPDKVMIQYVLLPCHMEGLALGALIAIRFRSGSWEIPKAPLMAGTGLLLLVTSLGSYFSKSPSPGMSCISLFARLPGYTMSSFGCAGLVLCLILFRGSPYTRLLRTPAVRYMAVISYGIYLLHPLVSRFVRSWDVPALDYGTYLRFFVAASLSVAAASVSWFAFERPLARLKDRIAPRLTPSDSKSAVPETQPSVLNRDLQGSELAPAEASGS